MGRRIHQGQKTQKKVQSQAVKPEERCLSKERIAGVADAAYKTMEVLLSQKKQDFRTIWGGIAPILEEPSKWDVRDVLALAKLLYRAWSNKRKDKALKALSYWIVATCWNQKFQYAQEKKLYDTINKIQEEYQIINKATNKNRTLPTTLRPDHLYCLRCPESESGTRWFSLVEILGVEELARHAQFFHRNDSVSPVEYTFPGKGKKTREKEPEWNKDTFLSLLEEMDEA